MKTRHWGKCAFFLLLFPLLLTGCGGAVASPQNVAVEFGTDHTARVTWDTVEGADGYRVFKKDSDSTDYEYLCDVEENEYLDSGLTHGETYFYKIKTLEDGRVSDGTESSPAKFMDIPSITALRLTDGGGLALDWEDTGAEGYRLYGMSAGGMWTVVSETKEPRCELTDFSAYRQLAVSAVYRTGEGEYETPRSQTELVLDTSSRITAVTQMDRYTAVVQYEAVENAEVYHIYRCETENGTYALAGTSYDTVYYDEIEDGRTYYYKVQPSTDRMDGRLSGAARLGTNAKAVSGVAVFMYHEFVTQEDLDAGVAFGEYAVWAEEFEQDLRYLKQNGYTTITSAQLADFLNGKGALPEKAVLLTIDDGKLGVYKHAYPLLRKYGMKASLAVIGERIDAATDDLQARAADPAPYCTWSEIKEMSDSGVIEVVSHSYTRHRYSNNGYTGANLQSGQSEDAFYQAACRDAGRMDEKLREVTGKGTVTFSYPYSVRTPESDRVWMRCGYEILYCGDNDDVRHSQLNYYVRDAGVNYYSARLRRLVRLTGTPLQVYLERAIYNDDWPLF